MPLSAITIEEVDRYRQMKMREARALEEARAEMEKRPPAKREKLQRPLSNGSINKMIRLLAAILEQAVEYDLMPKNPAKGRRRLLRESKPRRPFLHPMQAEALLATAGELDTGARDGPSPTRFGNFGAEVPEIRGGGLIWRCASHSAAI
jgi:hypothetical protein